MTEKQAKWIVCEDPNTGDARRINLSAAQYLELDLPCGAGITLEAAYLTPRSKRLILQYYSIWQRHNTGEIVGRYYDLADADKTAWVARRSQHPDLIALVPKADW